MSIGSSVFIQSDEENLVDYLVNFLSFWQRSSRTLSSCDGMQPLTKTPKLIHRRAALSQTPNPTILRHYLECQDSSSRSDGGNVDRQVNGQTDSLSKEACSANEGKFLCLQPFHQFLASTSSYEVVPVKVKPHMRIDLGVGDLAEDWQLQVAGRRSMLLATARMVTS